MRTSRKSSMGTTAWRTRRCVLTLAYAGLRPGELCALRWDDLTPGDREMHVRRSLDATGQEKQPKNGKPRVVTIPPRALEALSNVPRSLADGYVFH